MAMDGCRGAESQMLPDLPYRMVDSPGSPRLLDQLENLSLAGRRSAGSGRMPDLERLWAVSNVNPPMRCT